MGECIAKLTVHCSLLLLISFLHLILKSKFLKAIPCLGKFFQFFTVHRDHENRKHELSRKITKIVINILQNNSDNERYLQNALKQAIFKILRLHYLKFQMPTAYGLILTRRLSGFEILNRETLIFQKMACC